VANPDGEGFVRHTIGFAAENQAFRLREETITGERPGVAVAAPKLFYTFGKGRPRIRIADQMQPVRLDRFDANASIPAQRQDPDAYLEVTNLSDQYGRICAYREWALGRNTIFRVPQRADMRNDRLREDFANLGLVLNRMRRNPLLKNTPIEHLRDIYEGVDDFDVSVEGGTVQVFFAEGRYTIPATRLSDGSLRYLCLLAILCDPAPPPLICIEEPELGLHPDILPKIADLLVQASARTQLIVTTHSDVLIDALTERPEAVLVCEKHAGQTEVRRLSTDELSAWLTKYRLGELWMRGELGGTRW
jgi:predicted ATPase